MEVATGCSRQSAGDDPACGGDDSGPPGGLSRDGSDSKPKPKPKSKSKATCFRCPYHGWTYDDKGALTKATRLTGIEGFDVSDNGLKPLRVDTWGPFVFVNLGGDDASAPPPVNEWLGEAGERMRSAGVAEVRYIHWSPYDRVSVVNAVP